MYPKPEYTGVLLKVQDYNSFIANLNTEAAINERIEDGVAITTIKLLEARDDSSAIIFVASTSTKDGLVGLMERLGADRLYGIEALDAVKAYYRVKAFEEYDKMINHYTRPQTMGRLFTNQYNA